MTDLLSFKFVIIQRQPQDSFVWALAYHSPCSEPIWILRLAWWAKTKSPDPCLAKIRRKWANLGKICGETAVNERIEFSFLISKNTQCFRYSDRVYFDAMVCLQLPYIWQHTCVWQQIRRWGGMFGGVGTTNSISVLKGNYHVSLQFTCKVWH